MAHIMLSAGVICAAVGMSGCVRSSDGQTQNQTRQSGATAPTRERGSSNSAAEVESDQALLASEEQVADHATVDVNPVETDAVEADVGTMPDQALLADETTVVIQAESVAPSASDIEETKKGFAALKKLLFGSNPHVTPNESRRSRRSAIPLPVLPTQEKKVQESSSHLVIWDDYESTIEIAANGSATVKTYDLQGKLLVSYSGKTYVSDTGALIVDARGAAVSGPWARRWSPDSFTISDDGVKTIDDYHRKKDGVETPVSTN